MTRCMTPPLAPSCSNICSRSLLGHTFPRKICPPSAGGITDDPLSVHGSGTSEKMSASEPDSPRKSASLQVCTSCRVGECREYFGHMTCAQWGTSSDLRSRGAGARMWQRNTCGAEVRTKIVGGISRTIGLVAKIDLI